MPTKKPRISRVGAKKKVTCFIEDNEAQYWFDLAECQKKTVAELMGIVPAGTPMSFNEFQWWVARSSRKPLPAIREEFYSARQAFFSYGNSGNAFDRPYRTLNDAYGNWFKLSDIEDDDFRKMTKEFLEKGKKDAPNS